MAPKLPKVSGLFMVGIALHIAHSLRAPYDLKVCSTDHARSQVAMALPSTAKEKSKAGPPAKVGAKEQAAGKHKTKAAAAAPEVPSSSPSALTVSPATSPVAKIKAKAAAATPKATGKSGPPKKEEKDCASTMIASDQNKTRGPSSQ
jgi:hypothetical protein